MNSSAKISLTLLGAAALGTLAFACTVGSGTVDDVDGGTSSSSSSTSSSSSSGSSEAGADAGPLCPAFKPAVEGTIVSDACQECLETSCCSELAGCFNIGDDTSAKLGCDNYVSGIEDCDTNADPNGCKGLTKAAARPEIPALYDTFLTCRTDKCASTCNVNGAFGADAGP